MSEVPDGAYFDPMRYEAARDNATELGGRYIARLRAARDAGDTVEAERWSRLHRELWDVVRVVHPENETAVNALRDFVHARLRAL